MTIEERRRMLIFRSWHRGTREMDMLMGSFADAHVPNFNAHELDDYERILTCQDPDLYDWKCGRTQPPEEEQSKILELFIHTPLPLWEREAEREARQGEGRK